MKNLFKIQFLLLLLANFLFSEEFIKIKKGIELIGKEKNQEFIISSKISKQKYLIQVYEPKIKTPKEGYKVVYILDGNASFPLASTIAQTIENSSNRTGKIPPLIVAIAYPSEETFDKKARSFDYTPPYIGELKIPENRKSSTIYTQGGAEYFYKFIEEQLKPIINKTYKINKEKQILFGHSYGGLFTLYTFLNHTSSFQHYIAASPSIWWNDFQILKEAKNFKNNINPHTKLWLSVGELENKQSNFKSSLIKENSNIEQFLVDLGKNANLESRIFKFSEASHIEALFKALTLLYKLD